MVIFWEGRCDWIGMTHPGRAVRADLGHSCSLISPEQPHRAEDGLICWKNKSHEEFKKGRHLDLARSLPLYAYFRNQGGKE
jgi:hypothetical protein